MATMTKRYTCRACACEHGEVILDLGLQPLANNLLAEADLDKSEPKFPLKVFVCPSCWLLQITDLVPPVDLFSDYIYFSSFSAAWVEHARRAAAQHVDTFGLGPSSLVIEVASNDGYFLKHFKQRGIPVLGIEPAANIAQVAEEQEGIESLVAFFDEALGQRLAAEGRQADLVLGNNVFAHAPDTRDFVAGLREVLKPGGRAVLEFPYAADFIAHREFDTVYHEHVFYFALTPLLRLFQAQGLEIFRVERLPTHGGSLRLYAGHPGGHEVDPLVAAMATEEEAIGLTDIGTYRELSGRVEALKVALCERLAALKADGKSIAAYGASAKGSTLLNTFGIGSETLDFIVDRSTHKQGRYSPGTHLPILAPEALLESSPDYVLLLTWNFAEEILEQQAEYRARGGRFIVPIPDVRTV
jgi:SAM-dependent methyltransferase